MFQQLKPSLTASALHEALKQRWQGEPWIYLTHSQPEEQVAKQLLSVYQQSQQQPISAHQEQKVTPLLMQISVSREKSLVISVMRTQGSANWFLLMAYDLV
ncbi:hypothetical protein ACT691_18885 [Vibrio metschnikovii]